MKAVRTSAELSHLAKQCSDQIRETMVSDEQQRWVRSISELVHHYVPFTVQDSATWPDAVDPLDLTLYQLTWAFEKLKAQEN